MKLAFAGLCHVLLLLILGCHGARPDGRADGMPRNAYVEIPMPERELVRRIESALIRTELLEPVAASMGINTVAGAYRLQDEVCRGLVGYQGPVVGYKLALTQAGMMQKWKVSEPIHGPLYSLGQWRQSKKLGQAGSKNLLIECEIAIKIRRQIDVKLLKPVDILPYVESVHLALEIARMPFVGQPQVLDLIMVGAGSYGYVLNEATPVHQVLAKPLPLHLKVGGKEVPAGKVADFVEGPLTSLAWLTNKLIREKGKAFKPGDIVLTGSQVPPFTIDHISEKHLLIQANCPSLGVVSIVLEQ